MEITKEMKEIYFSHAMEAKEQGKDIPIGDHSPESFFDSYGASEISSDEMELLANAANGEVAAILFWRGKWDLAPLG